MARWADWQGRAKQISIAAIASEDATPMMFVSNELLVDSEDGDLVAELTSMGATIVPQLPLQPLPFGMERRELTGEFPMPVRLQFAEPPRVAFLPGEPDLGHPDARHLKLPLISGKARA